MINQKFSFAAVVMAYTSNTNSLAIRNGSSAGESVGHKVIQSKSFTPAPVNMSFEIKADYDYAWHQNHDRGTEESMAKTGVTDKRGGFLSVSLLGNMFPANTIESILHEKI